MEKISKIAKKYKLKVIEDCAQAQGAKFRNKFVGSFGDISIMSCNMLTLDNGVGISVKKVGH